MRSSSTTDSGRVEGYDANGHEIEMKVDAASGNIVIVKIERDD